MEEIKKYVHEFFEKLVKRYGLSLVKEIDEGHSYMVEYSSQEFIIKIEKYFREFYASLYKIGDRNNEMNLFNLLEYLKQGAVDVPKSEYFRKEEIIEESYRKQLKHIYSVIDENYSLISNFFDSHDYKARITEFEKYWQNKHPELYRKR